MLFKWYSNLSIKLKLYLTNILIILVPICILGVSINNISTNIIVKYSINNSIQSLNVIHNGVESLLKQVEYLSKLAVNNNNVQQILNLSIKELTEDPAERLEVVRSLDTIVGNEDLIRSAILFTNQKVVLSSSKPGTYTFNAEDFILSTKISDILEAKGKVIWRSTQPITYYSGKDFVDCISLFRALIDSKTGKTSGVLELDVDQQILANLVTNTSDVSLGQTLITSADGVIISSVNRKDLYRKITNENYFNWIVTHNGEGKAFTIKNKRFLVTSVKYERLNWNIISLTPLEAITKDSQKISNLILFVGSLCVLLAVSTSMLNSTAIIRPIIRLTRYMSHAGDGDLEVRAPVNGKDEVGVLSKSFNDMVERISELMDHVYFEQKKKKEYELQALQAQINPHFLYNTLESICALAYKQSYTDVISMVKSLGIFYRTSLSNGKHIITIKEEIENIRNYLLIQKYRYADKIDYTIHLDDNIEHYSIVKLTLQPLIENSIYHGLREKTGRGMIQITGKIEKGCIIISIIDDGIGMDLNTMNEILLGNEHSNSYGLRNVNDRIKIYFGSDYGLKLYQNEGSGLGVDVVLPAVNIDF